MQAHAFLGQPAQAVQAMLDEAGLAYTISYTYPNKRDEMGDDMRVVRANLCGGVYALVVSGFRTAIDK